MGTAETWPSNAWKVGMKLRSGSALAVASGGVDVGNSVDDAGDVVVSDGPLRPRAPARARRLEGSIRAGAAYTGGDFIAPASFSKVFE